MRPVFPSPSRLCRRWLPVPLLALAVCGSVAAQGYYSVQVISSGYPSCFPSDMNNQGTSLAYCTGSSNAYHQYDEHGNVLRVVPWACPIGSKCEYVFLNAINNWGDVAGTVFHHDDPRLGRVWKDQGFKAKVFGPEGSMGADAMALSDSGHVAGSVQIPPDDDGQWSGYVWHDGVMQVIDAGWGIDVMAVNNSGVAVGHIWSKKTGGWRAFSFHDGRLTKLAALGSEYSSANDINDSGRIVGWAFATDGYKNAVIWDGEEMQVLPRIGAESTWAESVNRHGQVVGTYGPVSSLRGGFLYDGTVMTDLQSLLSPEDRKWKIRQAVSINDRGWILVEGMQFLGYPTVLLLKPPQ